MSEPRFSLSSLVLYVTVVCVLLALLSTALAGLTFILLPTVIGGGFGYLMNGRLSGMIVGGIGGAVLAGYLLLPAHH